MSNPFNLFPYLPLVIFFSGAHAQQTTFSPPSAHTYGISFRPSVAIVISIFGIMFALTFLLLVYAKFCHITASRIFFTETVGGHDRNLLLPASQPRFSGTDKTIIESLPFFRFSALRGSREGLECAVCLSKFEDTEILRLLPKCKHAFHIECVDRWLESHSSCPLCRHRVFAEDAAMFKYSSSSRFSFRNSSSRRGDDAGGGEVELFVEREPEERVGSMSARFGLGSSFRLLEKAFKEPKDELLTPEEATAANAEGNNNQFYHKFKHRIIVSHVMFQSRWSDVNSSDFLALNSVMLGEVSSKRFAGREGMSASNAAAKEEKGPMDERTISIKVEMEKKRLLESKAGQISRGFSSSSHAAAAEVTSSSALKSLIPSGNRSMSEITNLSRFADATGRSMSGRDQGNTAGSAREEKMRQVWIPIAQRTVQWFAGRERRPAASAVQTVEFTREVQDV